MTMRIALTMVVLMAGASSNAATQGAAAARAVAPIDVTGYWVSVITEDWRLRMITPPKGDYQNVPLNASGTKLVDSWNPETDRAGGAECAGYGAAAAMRMPTRIHITWQDANALRFDFDSGQQTRVVNFDGSAQPGERSWQGFAVGEWVDLSGRRFVTAQRAAEGQGGLKVVTTHLRAQYLRKNGVPVSESATVTDLIERITGPAQQEWLIVKTIIHDPVYLTADLVTSAQFKREPDGSKWNPTPCEVELPPRPRPLRDPPSRSLRPPASVVTP